MIYKETGQYKSSYKSDHAIFPLLQDKIAFSTLMLIAFLIIPFVINSYWEKAILVPFLIFSLAAIGLNILTGYCGQVSLGTGGFMAVGAFSTYKIMTYFPDMNIMIIILISGLITAAVGIIFGLPSLRIKGFYLAVATLASQFFLVWLFNKVPWFYNYSDTGQITVSERTMFGIPVTGAEAPSYATYLFCLVLVVTLSEGSLIGENELRDHCKSLLAGFKVPRYFNFVELPKTSTGKIQKFKLREQAKLV